ncbi:hypothetical protein [Anaeromicropila herbilytica]|uniref:Uncharacterized protein n=1 Tax=Anaeromicropila herbilytica TaxID=2785025 RepID=A0A7R7EJY6_9FIRM|nr:hypothetical protein [Anaeromicropila herbilytica]BCN30119.1 hypothetical protein bsdtb5_14140 [Anaeromicropila herbilytica]
MLIQILEEYKTRTEYRLLNNFCNYEMVNINALKKGTLVLSGILLNKMKKEEINTLNLWLENNSNQLILLPAWGEINLSNYFTTSVDIKVKKTESFFNGIPINYGIEAVVKDKMFCENGKNFGINYRNNLSSGLITVVTLPLLDYKMMDFHDEFKIYFDKLIQNIDCVKEILEENDDEIDIDNVHVFLIILSSAKVQLKNVMASIIFKYFGARYEEELLVRKYKELVSGEYINDEKLTDKGMRVVKEKNLRAFINVIKERKEKENDDGWS